MSSKLWTTLKVSSLLFGAMVVLIAGCAKPDPSPAGMVWIPGGSFVMGTENGLPDEAPAHKVNLTGFWMDATEVTNRQFAEFVKATGYITEAEKQPDPAAFPDVPKDKLLPGALVFSDGKGWEYVPGASWRHPTGPKSNIEAIMDHPVVQVSWNDAMAYANWAGKSLPTEAQFEYAARGGDPKSLYAWGVQSPDDKHPQANIWQGEFPLRNENTDGFLTTSPPKSFKPNPYGLYDMAGNVWEWCLDWYRHEYSSARSPDNPTGPVDSFDPAEPKVAKRVVRGGSFLCADCYCRGYRLTARMKTSPDTGLMHTGFRCVINGAKFRR